VGRLLDGEVLVGLTYLTPRRVWISYATGTLFIRAPKTPSSLQLPRLPELPAEPVTSSPIGTVAGNPCLRLAAGQCGLAPEPNPDSLGGPLQGEEGQSPN